MNVTKTVIFNGCLIASIAHAVMTNVYPELSYEQSWDGENYSIQNSSGLRGTISFEKEYCIGAVRNENFGAIIGGDCIQKYMRHFPLNVINKAHEETLQYLLLERDGIVAPYVTSVFWADHTTIHFADSCADSIKKDFVLFENLMLPEEIVINKWTEYYGMDSKAIELINGLYPMKAKDFFSVIKLSERQRNLIPGSYINKECAEALKELNIIL